jgi:hypothetical protein
MEVEIPEARAVSPVGAKIFTPDQVGLATFLGGPLGGGALLALSHRRAGTGRALMPLVVGVALTAASIVAAIVLGSNLTFVIPLAGVFAMRALAQQQAPAIEAAAGATVRASSWSAVGIAVATLVATVVVGGGAYVAYAEATEAPAIDFGHDHEVQYADGATAAEARRVGDLLNSDGVFEHAHNGMTVRLERAGGELHAKFVFRDGAWDDADVIAFGELVHGELAGLFPADHVAVELCDDELESHRTIR